MKSYKIPVTAQYWGYYQIEAESLEEAIQKVLDGDTPPRSENEYIDDSEAVDYDGIAFHNRGTVTEEEVEKARQAIEGPDELEPDYNAPDQNEISERQAGYQRLK